MLRKPRQLPQRFNRPVTPQTRRLVQHRMHRRREDTWKRWMRIGSRWHRQVIAARRSLMGFLLFAVPATLIVGIGFFLYSSVLHVQEVRILLTDPRIDVTAIRQGLTPLLGRHLFFLPLKEAVQMTRDTVPDLQDVTVYKEYPSTIVLRLTLTPIIAQLEIENPNVRAGSGGTANPDGLSEYLTENGIFMRYDEGQVRTGSGLLPLHIVDWGVRPTPGTVLLDPEFLSEMKGAERMLREELNRDVTLRTVYLRAREYHLRTADHVLWFDLRSPFSEQLGRYRTFLQVEGTGAAQRYVDLRLVDKVVYQ